MNGFFINTPIAQRSANYCLWINEWILKEKKEKIVFLEFKIIYFACLFRIKQLEFELQRDN